MSFKIRMQAFGDLMARYRAVWQQSWKDKEQSEADKFRLSEAQFLPAALALQEEPVSPAPRVALWLLIIFSMLALLWSIFGQIDIVATAEGKIIPSNRTKTIQPLETAVVKAIHVSDGQHVKAGDVLVELDSAMLAADRDHIESSLAAAKLQAARGRALINAIRTGNSPRIESMTGVDPSLIAKAQQWVNGQYSELVSKLAQIDAENERKAEEIKSTEELVKSLEQTVPIEEARAQDLSSLVGEGYVSKHTYYDRQQSWLEKKGNLANQRSRLRELEAALREGQKQRQALIAETRRTTLDSYNEGEEKVAGLGQDFIKADTHSKLMTLTSPVDGTIQQLAIHTVGGVVTPAQALMMVVPNNDVLEVEAFLQNKDIGFISVGQEAEIKVETFQYTKYGTVRGLVAHVSHDAIEDEKKGRIYSVRVKLDKVKMQVDQKTVDLAPGESVTASIKTGKRRVIEYFLSPLIQYQKESLGER